MLISPSRSRIPTIDFRINLDGAEMKTRLLGIIIDDSLSWSYHIDSVCCKVGRKIGALRRSFRLLTPPPPPCQENIFYISDSAWLGICRSDFYTKHERRSEKLPSGCLAESNPLRSRCWILSIATEMVSAPPVRGILQGGQQVSSTILMYTEKRGRGTILVAIESIKMK